MENVNETVTTTEQTQETAPTKPLSFDEMLANGYQSEFDRRNTKAMNTAIANAKSEWETSRNKDLLELQEKLKGFEGAQAEFEALSKKHAEEKEAWQKEQEKQSYEFAIKTLSNDLQFTSKSAKNQFIREATEAGLKMKDGSVMGFNDFVTKYVKDDPSAIKEKEEETKPTPTFVKGSEKSVKKDTNPFTFNFSGVRPKPKE